MPIMCPLCPLCAHYEDHHGFFPTGVSSIVDTLSIIVYSPTDPLARAVLYYVPDKYAAVGFKGEIVTDLLGRVISFTALHAPRGRGHARRHDLVPW
jgi:hypothetical protein